MAAAVSVLTRRGHAHCNMNNDRLDLLRREIGRRMRASRFPGKGRRGHGRARAFSTTFSAIARDAGKRPQQADHATAERARGAAGWQHPRPHGPGGAGSGRARRPLRVLKRFAVPLAARISAVPSCRSAGTRPPARSPRQTRITRHRFEPLGGGSKRGTAVPRAAMGVNRPKCNTYQLCEESPSHAKGAVVRLFRWL